MNKQILRQVKWHFRILVFLRVWKINVLNSIDHPEKDTKIVNISEGPIWWNPLTWPILATLLFIALVSAFADSVMSTLDFLSDVLKLKETTIEVKNGRRSSQNRKKKEK